MSTLKHIKDMGSEKVKEYISSSNLNKKEKPEKIVVGLHNNDVEGPLLGLLDTEVDKVIEGMLIVASTLEVDCLFLYLPEYAQDKGKNIETKMNDKGIKIKFGIIDVRENQNNAIFHITTMIDIANVFNGIKEEVVYVSIDGGGLRKVSYGTKFSELIESPLDEIKCFEIGTSFYDVSVLKYPIEVIPITNGVVNVITKEACIVDEVKKKLLKYRNQSCGKCVFCREGLIQLSTMTSEISKGKGKNDFLSLIKEIGETMKFSTPCSLGQTSSDIILRSIELYEDEYKTHINKKKCPTEICISSAMIYIDPNKCKGCGECLDHCPKDCIDGKPKYIHMIDELECNKCGKCLEACEYEAIVKTRGRLPKLPTRLTRCGKFRGR